jgi:hypothetical protein
VLDAAELTTRLTRHRNKPTVSRLITVDTSSYTDAKAQKDRTAHSPPHVQFTSWLEDIPAFVLGVPLHEHDEWLGRQPAHGLSLTCNQRLTVRGYAPFIHLHNT